MREDERRRDAGGFMAQKMLWDVAKKGISEERGAFLEDDGAISCGNVGLCLRKLSQPLVARGFGKRESRNGEAERGSQNNKRVKVGNREVEREGERVEIKRKCSDRVSSEVFEDVSLASEVGSVGVFFGFSVCVHRLCVCLCLM